MVDVPLDPADARDPLQRDPQRTPMQWDRSPNAGFTTPGARPWLPLAPDAERVNVSAQAEDPESLLALTRRLLRLRREHPVLRVGDFEPIGVTPAGTYGFRRVAADGRLTVLLNLGSTVNEAAELRPNEAVVLEAGAHGLDSRGDR